MYLLCTAFLLCTFEAISMKLSTPITTADLAASLGLSFAGDPNQLITGINEIHMVEAGDLTFVDHPKYYEKALGSAATTVIINQQVEAPPGKTLLFSDKPFEAYNILTRHYRPFEPVTEHCSSSAIIGEGTVVQAGAVIGHHVHIGRDCIIHPNVVIYDHCIIGDRVVIHAGSVIGADAFYFKRHAQGADKMHSCGRVVIADDVEIGANCTLDKGVSGDTFIGRFTKMDNQVHIGHDTHVGERCLFAAQVGIAGVTRIEDEVILWGQVGVQKDLVIGKGAIVLGKSGVSKSLEGGKTYFGAPAEEARGKWRELALIRKLPQVMEALKL